MNLKKFAGFLIAGKIMSNTSLLQSADFQMNNSFASTDAISFSEIFNSNLTLIEEPVYIDTSGSSIEILKTFKDSFNPYGAENAAQILLPGENCNFQALQDFNLIVTGVKPGDSVFVIISDAYDDEYWSFISDKIKLGSNLKLIGSYTIYGSGNNNPDFSGDTNISFPVRLKVKLSDIEQFAGTAFYIQALIIPQESFLPDGQVDWNNVKASEVDMISANYTNCDSYGTPY